MVVPIVLATTARRSWARCSGADSSGALAMAASSRDRILGTQRHHRWSCFAPVARRLMGENLLEELAEIVVGLRAHGVVARDRIGPARGAQPEPDLAPERRRHRQ